MTTPASPGMRLVDCPGEAHSNPYVDNCLRCAPRWGKVEIPVEFETIDAYLDAEDKKRDGK